MVHTTNPNNRITVHFECFDEGPGNNYIAWIDGDRYRGIVVSGNSIGDCVREIGISLVALEHYRKNTKKQPDV